MQFLKKSTAATIKLGPFIDDTDGKTAETALTISQADIRLSKNGGDIAQTNNSAGATHDELGYYNVPLDTTDTNTLGRLKVMVHESGALPVWAEYLVVTANVYDTFCSTDKLEVELATGHGLATATALQTVDDNVDAILADTGTDGVVVASGQTVATVTNLTNLPSIPANWITAAGVATGAIDADAIASNAITSAKIATGAITNTKFASGAIDAAAIATDAIGSAEISAAAVTKIQNGLALEATLTAIKGAGWSTQTLVGIYEALNTGFNGASVEDTINSIIVPLAGVGWTNQTLVAIKAAIDLLATAANLATVDSIVDAIKAKSDLIPASPAQAGEYTAAIAAIPTTPLLAENYTAPDNASITAIKSVVDDILVDTGTTLDTLVKDIPTNAELATALSTADDAVLAAVAAAKAVIDDMHDTDIPAIPTAAEVWSSPIRTLTVPAVAIASNVDGTTLSLYKDADINIEFTGLTIPTGSKKVVFTIKGNLDDADTASALQATYQLVAPSTETHTLNYVNSAVPTGLTNPVTFTVDTDSVEFDMTAAAAYYLPRYERGYLHWDLKLITATTVQILQQGLVQILGTSTRAVA